jgi:hypothetical protein
MHVDSGKQLVERLRLLERGKEILNVLVILSQLALLISVADDNEVPPLVVRPVIDDLCRADHTPVVGAHGRVPGPFTGLPLIPWGTSKRASSRAVVGGPCLVVTGSSDSPQNTMVFALLSSGSIT